MEMTPLVVLLAFVAAAFYFVFCFNSSSAGQYISVASETTGAVARQFI